ncbi:hypothetical protein F5Y16DRAFT_54642 [Xylariaceae sp. FL0255]|nr:hypothetical protein F5Y16DRAFT_54642 [Xylariaceae sp. FL0255]
MQDADDVCWRVEVVSSSVCRGYYLSARKRITFILNVPFLHFFSFVLFAFRSSFFLFLFLLSQISVYFICSFPLSHLISRRTNDTPYFPLAIGRCYDCALATVANRDVSFYLFSFLFFVLALEAVVPVFLHGGFVFSIHRFNPFSWTCRLVGLCVSGCLTVWSDQIKVVVAVFLSGFVLSVPLFFCVINGLLPLSLFS